ncbi:hypothetical protein [Microbacterium candidum]|uniref:Uncharacterized protein n=1 Tax=Microbacterium candidum TaxID=3041922 RepID=A0ABT7MWL6_9MICO|nr:hypothetical protein [Microbacterium sp. ASV49]MDL9978851.1 hypothetical protein [Microbacterium sp. ASV49]
MTITAGAAVISPILIHGFESSREAGTIVHDVIGRANPDITLRPASLRTGTARLLFADETASKSAEDALSLAVTCTLTTELASASFPFVVRGPITRTLNESRVTWLVAFEFQEIAP